MIRTGLLVAAVAAAIMASAAIAQGPGPVLHEDIRPPAGNSPGTVGSAPTAGQNPSAILSGDKLLAEPEQTAKKRDEEPVFGTKAYGADRETTWNPDSNTGPDATLHYVEVFNPSTLPFKRMSVLDLIAENGSLQASSASLYDVKVGGEKTSDRDLFWGDLYVNLATGRDVPIPSVSPGMRILSYKTTPHTALEFSKDAADNYYVRSEEPGVAGKYRIVFLVAAEASYFAPNPPPSLKVRALPQSRVAKIPAMLQRDADRAVQYLGLHRNLPVKKALNELISYFRSFEAKKLRPGSSTLFWDLFRNQAGVCRHRSYAFVITASALGIPSRYATNEAHAWVEVWLPGQEWVRVDLGGAALRLQVSNAENKSMYRPRGEDPFSKPKAYEENYTQLEGEISGLSAGQLGEARGPRREGAGLPGSDSSESAVEDPGEGLIGPGKSLPPVEDQAGKSKTSLAISEVSGPAFRGSALVVRGRLSEGEGIGVANMHIDLYLAPKGRDGEDSLWVGVTKSTQDGTFAAEFEIPFELSLGRYEVYAASPGDDTYAAALSD